MDTTACTLVTGGTGVIGRAIVQRLLDQGARVALTYSSGSVSLEQLLVHASNGPGELFAVQADFRSLVAHDLIDEVEAHSTKVSALVYSAALVDHTNLGALSPERFNEVLNVNVIAAYALVRELVSRGSLTNVVLLSSIASSIADLGSVAYTTSKGATDALTRALAVELSPAIRVNAVAPGIVRSHRTTGDPLFSGPTARIPDGALVDPDEAAALVEFLLNDPPRSLHGQVLTIDGGVSLRRLG